MLVSFLSSFSVQLCRSPCRDLGAHVDGFVAVVAHTVVVGASPKLTGRQADVMLAAHYASEAALRLVKPGSEVNG